MSVQSASWVVGSLWAVRDISSVDKRSPGLTVEAGGTNPPVLPAAQGVSRGDRLLQGLLVRERRAEWVIGRRFLGLLMSVQHRKCKQTVTGREVTSGHIC